MSILEDSARCLEARHVYCVAVPVDLELYRSLLPRQFALPEQPMVDLTVFAYDRVRPRLFRPYLEAFIRLRCTYDGVEGWFIKTAPVTSRAACWAGRRIGFPKYTVDAISLEGRPDCWTGEVKDDGAVIFRIEVAPGATWSGMGSEDKVLGESMTLRPLFLLLPVDKGPGVQEIMVEDLDPGTRLARGTGPARLTLAPVHPLAGLFGRRSAYPGRFGHWTGVSRMVPRRLA